MGLYVWLVIMKCAFQHYNIPSGVTTANQSHCMLFSCTTQPHVLSHYFHKSPPWSSSDSLMSLLSTSHTKSSHSGLSGISKTCTVPLMYSFLLLSILPPSSPQCHHSLSFHTAVTCNNSAIQLSTKQIGFVNYDYYYSSWDN